MNQYKDSVYFLSMTSITNGANRRHFCAVNLFRRLSARPATDTPRNYLEFLIFRPKRGMTLHAAENDFPRAAGKTKQKNVL